MVLMDQDLILCTLFICVRLRVIFAALFKCTADFNNLIFALYQKLSFLVRLV